MQYGVKAHYKGRYHTEVPANEADQILPEGQRFVSVLWAGGWDEYVVDTNNIRPVNQKELDQMAYCRSRGGGISAEYDGWVYCSFLKHKDFLPAGTDPENSMIKVVQHLAGGD